MVEMAVLSRIHMIQGKLSNAAGSVDDLHRLVSAAVERGAKRDDSFLRWAQTVDILEQKLSALSHYVGELAELMPEHWVVKNEAATKKLKLSRLAERLGRLSDHPDLGAEHASGEFEIF